MARRGRDTLFGRLASVSSREGRPFVNGESDQHDPVSREGTPGGYADDSASVASGLSLGSLDSKGSLGSLASHRTGNTMTTGYSKRSNKSMQGNTYDSHSPTGKPMSSHLPRVKVKLDNMEINFVTANSNLSLARQNARKEASVARDPETKVAPRHVVRARHLELAEEDRELWIKKRAAPHSVYLQPGANLGPHPKYHRPQLYVPPGNIPFTVAQKRNLKLWFDSMDKDGGGEISVEELEDPLLSTGIAKSTAEVEQLIAAVDKDGTREIGFDEFLHVLRPPPPSPPHIGKHKKSKVKRGPELKPKRDGAHHPHEKKHGNKIVQLQKLQQKGSLSMDTIICQQRRQRIIDAVMNDMVSQVREHHHNELQFAQAKSQRNEDAIQAARRKKDDTMKMMRGRNEFMNAMKRVVDSSYKDMGQKNRRRNKEEDDEDDGPLLARDDEEEGGKDQEEAKDSFRDAEWYTSSKLKGNLTPRTEALGEYAREVGNKRNGQRKHEKAKKGPRRRSSIVKTLADRIDSLRSEAPSMENSSFRETARRGQSEGEFQAIFRAREVP
eukprot:CAMPEP_0119484414 /NCGR_PEP_ID=MMETSP1344-20130328/11438_1 /TAXON_ID=236787 /ORGANISM="Florenciella parvula, Strain CCMP2471" /LENGTH=553 /DNA_ID=CAMNT_0007518993 /DNA_START=217 /DNA_END=1879 /DNA_ORIENTATION=+